MKPLHGEPTEHEHQYEEQWFPLDRTHVRRKCCWPHCLHYEVKEVN